jgi:hypothetical protein
MHTPEHSFERVLSILYPDEYTEFSDYLIDEKNWSHEDYNTVFGKSSIKGNVPSVDVLTWLNSVAGNPYWKVDMGEGRADYKHYIDTTDTVQVYLDDLFKDVISELPHGIQMQGQTNEEIIDIFSKQKAMEDALSGESIKMGGKVLSNRDISYALPWGLEAEAHGYGPLNRTGGQALVDSILQVSSNPEYEFTSEDKEDFLERILDEMDSVKDNVLTNWRK